MCKTRLLILTMLVSSVACGEDNSIAVDGEECGRLEIELDDTTVSKLVLCRGREMKRDDPIYLVI